MNNRLFFAIFILLSFINSSTSFGSDTLRRKKPSVILVQLRSEHNRIEALTKRRMFKEVEEVKKDAREVVSRMILDFRVHFNYCPVYYYVDTNIELIRKKQYDGILLNEDLTPAKNALINRAGNDYYIVYFGYAAAPTEKIRVETENIPDPTLYNTNYGDPYGRSLVINNDTMKQIGYVYTIGPNLRILRKKRKTLFYNSKHFDIEYYPLAELLDIQLKENKGQIIKKGRASN